tara:strand:+ start:111 stop:440 length:330 start_codon:yes stop_codon:yes gene_type:complete
LGEEMAKGIKTSIFQTGVSAEVTGEVFEDELVSIGTAVLANITGSGGTLVIERKMDSSGNWVELSSETVTAGTPLVLNYDFPLLEARAKFTPTSTSTLVEVAFWSKGRE